MYGGSVVGSTPQLNQINYEVAFESYTTKISGITWKGLKVRKFQKEI